MEINTFIEQFAEQFDETGISEFKPETVFHDLEEYGSLIALSIILMVDEEYGVTVDGNEMSSCVTIEDLFNLVREKKEQ